MAEASNRVPIDVHLNGDLGEVTKTLTGQGVTVAASVTATGPLAVLMQLITPADVPVGAMVQPVVVGSSVVGFRVQTSDTVAELRRAILARGRQQPPSRGRRTRQ